MSMASDCFSVLCVERGSMERFGFGSINSLESNSSLPSVSNHHTLSERRVAAWAVSFERLLQDPVGVRYFSVSRTRHELANMRHFVLCLPLSFLSKRYLSVCCGNAVVWSFLSFAFLCYRRSFWKRSLVKKTFYSGRPVNSSARFLNMTRSR